MPGSVHSKLSEYELQRLERIKRNKAIMEQLGLTTAVKTIKKTAKASTSPRTPNAGSGKRKSRPKGSSSPIRRSGRQRGSPVVYTDTLDVVLRNVSLM